MAASDIGSLRIAQNGRPNSLPGDELQSIHPEPYDEEAIHKVSSLCTWVFSGDQYRVTLWQLFPVNGLFWTALIQACIISLVPQSGVIGFD